MSDDDDTLTLLDFASVPNLDKIVLPSYGCDDWWTWTCRRNIWSGKLISIYLWVWPSSACSYRRLHIINQNRSNELEQACLEMYFTSFDKMNQQWGYMWNSISHYSSNFTIFLCFYIFFFWDNEFETLNIVKVQRSYRFSLSCGKQQILKITKVQVAKDTTYSA